MCKCNVILCISTKKYIHILYIINKYLARKTKVMQITYKGCRYVQAKNINNDIFNEKKISINNEILLENYIKGK